MLTLTPTDLGGIAAKAQAWADIFRLPLQHRTWRGQTGDFQGSGVGSSLTRAASGFFASFFRSSS